MSGSRALEPWDCRWDWGSVPNGYDVLSLINAPMETFWKIGKTSLRKPSHYPKSLKRPEDLRVNRKNFCRKIEFVHKEFRKSQ